MAKKKPARRRAQARSTKTRARTRAKAPTPVAPWRTDEEELKKALATPEMARELEAYFGEEQYRELVRLNERARQRSVRGHGPRVLILPGIMGSTIGVRRALLDDVVWFDPIEVMAGGLTRLALGPGSKKLEALNALWLSYMRMKLALGADGYDAEFFPYDWRRPIAEAGAALVREIERKSDRDTWLVCHSMGGLVARSALHQAKSSGAANIKFPNVRRVIQLGTPNYGSFAPVQAMRGIYPVVRKIAQLDCRHTPEELAERVFSSFPGLYQMLPFREKFGGIDLWQLANWPAEAPRPVASLLADVEVAQRDLAGPDQRFVLIAGVEQDTVVDLRADSGKWVFESTLEGDGTVPLAFAKLPDVETYYVKESHGSLPNNGRVIEAVSALIGGSTPTLATSWAPTRARAKRSASEAQLTQVVPFEGREGTELSPADVREVLEEVASARSSADVAQPAAAWSATVKLGGVVVGRARQRRLDITLAHASITDVPARAYVLGIYRDVMPTGAANYVDERLGGAIADVTRRRMFTANLGATFLMPVGRSSLPVEEILLAGMGPFDGFSEDALELACENVVRTFQRTGVDEFATVLFGTGSGLDVGAAISRMVRGFVRGYVDADHKHGLRRIVVCELDPDRYALLRQTLLNLSASDVCDEVEVTFDELEIAPSVEPSVARKVADRSALDPVYLTVRQSTPMSAPQCQFDCSVLGSAGKAAIFSDSARFARTDLDALLREIERDKHTFGKLTDLGGRIANLVLPSSTRSVLQSLRDRHLVVVHDALASRVPWELVQIGDWKPPLEKGVSRRYLADNLSVAKWLEQRRRDKVMRVLLISNPTEDLDGAVEEADRVKKVLQEFAGVEIRELREKQAQHDVVLKELTSSRYDVVHYAGHAFFDPDRPARSGILCNGDNVVSGAELSRLGNLPALVFFNACESGRMRSASKSERERLKKLTAEAPLERSVGFAEAFLRGGVANFVGTYWPVGDNSASLFASEFYGGLLRGRSILDAVLTGRLKLNEAKERDWADYIHYGSPDFSLKQFES